ncbi:MAG: ATP-binding cassette domain-containing protein [Bifidobacteriaceae bacterium]|jgi:zinc transport system ATP-binding protein|nr:ATP-binding cassette domain-containing protein [Bifidobacteriaceae bacterium]
MSVTGAAVRVQDLHVGFDATQVLRGISLTIDTGDVVALLGANGSGKTTLVKAILGIVPMTRGSVRLLGVPLGRAVPWDRIGYVPQRSTATTGVPTTPLEVVASGLLAGRRLRPPRDARGRAEAALATMGLSERAHDTVAELSGGQQQRVLIARALVKDPALLILDEPNTGLDASSQDALVEALGARLVPPALTIVMVLHETGPYAPLITRSVVLRDGRIATDHPSPGRSDPTPPHHPSTSPPRRGPDLEWRP